MKNRGYKFKGIFKEKDGKCFEKFFMTYDEAEHDAEEILDSLKERFKDNGLYNFSDTFHTFSDGTNWSGFNLWFDSYDENGEIDDSVCDEADFIYTIEEI